MMSLPDFFSIFFLLIIEAKSGTITDHVVASAANRFYFSYGYIGKRTC